MTCLVLTMFVSNGSILNGQKKEVSLQNQKHNSYQIFSSSGSVTIPFEMNRGHIILSIAINDKILRLTLDNGNVHAPIFLYGSSKIDSLNLTYEDDVLVAGAGDGEMPKARKANQITLKLPGVEIYNQSLITMPFDPLLLSAFDGEDGVIGGAIWDNFVVNINFDKKNVTLIEFDQFAYSGKGEVFRLDNQSDGGSTLLGTIKLLNGIRISVPFHLDLGSPDAILINLKSHSGLTIPNKTIERRAFGSQGEFIQHIGRISFLQLGKFVINNVLTAFLSTDSPTAIRNASSIGSEVFQRFNLTFDYRNNRIILEPNRRFRSSFEFNMSGMDLKKTNEGNYEVTTIMPNSPASEVDLELHDLITEINGQSLKLMTRNELSRILRMEGEKIILRVLRNSINKIISLKLRRLI